MSKKAKIIKEETIFKKYSTIVEGEIFDNETEYTREKLVRKDAVAALIYNTDTDSIILVEQFRYPTVREGNDGYMLEVVAGKIDEGEKPHEAIKREILEEIGYKIEDAQITRCSRAYTTPGYSTEIIYYYLIKVKDKDKVPGFGGGMKDEHENIGIIEMPYLIFRSNLDCFNDLKTRMLGYEAHYRKFFKNK